MRRVGALVFPGFELLDLFGPLQLLGMLKDAYALHLIAENKGAVLSNQGVSAVADLAIDERDDFDVLLIPGGAGTRVQVANTSLIDWIARAAQNAEYTLSVCTGSALLARAGVLDGRKATTNKMAFSWVESQGPNVHWVKSARWVEDGKFITSSGVSAGMDMTLGFIRSLHGAEIAKKVAMWAEYAWQDDPARDDFAAIHGLA